jgi:hypothetical protein
MHDIEQSGFAEFDEWRALARRTRELLDAAMVRRALPDGGADYIADSTLPHIEGIQTGFVGWLRSDAAGVAELRYLLRLVGPIRVEPAASDAERRAEISERALETLLAVRDGDLASSPMLRNAEPWNLAALAHARLVLATLPSIPDDAVRYPAGRRTYADIPRPQGPAELAGRLEELERQLWRTATGRVPNPDDQGFRRAYGFFDAADQLGGMALGGAA